jgi:hypothetical protein
MIDRELLELATMAAGINVREFCENGLKIYGEGLCSEYIWNSLDDEGDALRLAIKLRISIWIEKTLVIAEVCSDCDDQNVIAKEYCDSETQSMATLRAITRAAAEIGKGMK